MSAPGQQPAGIFGRLRHFFGLEQSIIGLLVMVVLVGMGEKLAERFIPVYLVALGATPLIPGLLNALDTLLSALYSFPGGWLTSRLGYKRALLIFNCVALFGYGLVIVIPSWPAVIVGSVFFLSWTALSLPATMELVSRVLPKHKHTMGVSVHSLVRRIPMALGPLVGGIFIETWGIQTGVRLAFGLAAVLGLTALVAQQIMIIDDRGQAPGRIPGFFKLMRAMPRGLRDLLVSDILVRFCEQLPYAYIAIWTMFPDQQAMSLAASNLPLEYPYVGFLFPHGVSAVEFGVLTTIEMVTALLVYIPVAWLADRTRKKPFVLITFVNFTLFPLALWQASGFALLVPVFILRGLKEFGEPTRKALIMDLAPEGHRAAQFGVYYLVRDTVVSLSALGGAFLWQVHPTHVFILAAVCGLAGTLWFALRGVDTNPSAQAG